MQQLDAVGFFVRPQLGVFTASALVLEVFGNRFRCHGRSVAELSSSKLSNCDHSNNLRASTKTGCKRFADYWQRPLGNDLVPRGTRLQTLNG